MSVNAKYKIHCQLYISLEFLCTQDGTMSLFFLLLAISKYIMHFQSSLALVVRTNLDNLAYSIDFDSCLLLRLLHTVLNRRVLLCL